MYIYIYICTQITVTILIYIIIMIIMMMMMNIYTGGVRGVTPPRAGAVLTRERLRPAQQ